LEAQNNVRENWWNRFPWSQQKHIRTSFNLEIMFCGFPKEKRHIWENSRKYGLAHSRYSIVYPITLFFLILLTILSQT
jgi:hypothetical protein